MTKYNLEKGKVEIAERCRMWNGKRARIFQTSNLSPPGVGPLRQMRHELMIENLCSLLRYITQIFEYIAYLTRQMSQSCCGRSRVVWHPARGNAGCHRTKRGYSVWIKWQEKKTLVNGVEQWQSHRNWGEKMRLGDGGKVSVTPLTERRQQADETKDKHWEMRWGWHLSRGKMWERERERCVVSVLLSSVELIDNRSLFSSPRRGDTSRFKNKERNLLAWIIVAGFQRLCEESVDLSSP